MREFVTGGAGFIGSHLVDRLMADGREVTAYDNLSLGRTEHLARHEGDRHFRLVVGDCLDPEVLADAMRGAERVWHLAANSDVRKGAESTGLDFEQCAEATRRVLEAARCLGVRRFVFASSSTVYGDVPDRPLGEDHGPLAPISLYGAAKLAAEALVSAYAHLFDVTARVYRFANVVGPRLTHGAVYDFAAKLARDPSKLEVLGDGRQTKSYVHVADVVDAMLATVDLGSGPLDVYNLGYGDALSVAEIAEMAVAALAPGARIETTGGVRGWPGDVPRMTLDVSKLAATGWRGRYDSRSAVSAAVDEVARCRS